MTKYGISTFDMGLGAAFAVQRSLQSIKEAMRPSYMRPMMEMRETLRALKPAPMAGLHELHALRTSIATHDRLFASMSAVSQVMRGQELISSIKASAVTEQLRAALGPQLACSAMPSLRLAESLKSLIPRPLQHEWHEHLVKGIVPSFDLMSNWTGGTIGLLAFLPEAEAGASVSWLAEDDARPSVAALLADAARLPEIVVETVVRCAFCRCELLKEDKSFRWKGNRLRIDIDAIPICSACLEQAGDYAEFILDKLREFLRPPLKLVSSGGKSDGVRRGKDKIRLVRWVPPEDNEPDDPEDEDRE